MLKTIIEAIERVKGENIIIYDVKEQSPLFDNVVIASVDSARQASAAVSYIEEDLVKKGFSIKGIEGRETDWVLIDCYDVLVHIFTVEEREHFNLEKLYLNYKRVDINNL